ncbi:MAG: glutamyl-tRNA reductase [Flavobacterium sp.]|jgi:glutamyl-tRNA reductase
MERLKLSKHKTFYALGLSYKKADAAARGRFNIDEKTKINLLNQAKKEGIDALIVISTCNRTEMYGFAEHPFQFIKLLCEHSKGTLEEFQEVSYVYKNEDAIQHLFKVGTGLDSQIVGDFEIIGQVKHDFALSKKHNLVNSFLERLVNAVIQASKKIKNETMLSTGATSVAFASVHYIKNNIENISQKNILLFGTGKIGRNTCENLVKHTQNDHIVLINRTKENAEKIAGKFNLIVKNYVDLPIEIQKADILIVATGAQNPTIDKSLLNLKKPLLILDLSIPKNVSDNVMSNEFVKLIHLDELSQITNETLEKRKEHIPQAEQIIQEVYVEFSQWLNGRKYAPTIHALKEKLHQINDKEIASYKKKMAQFDEDQAQIISKKLILKITSHFASHLKNEDTSIDESIAFIEKIFQLETS